MNKRVKGIIGLSCTLAVLGGGLAFLKLTDPDKKGENTESSESSAAEVNGADIELINKDSNSINRIEITNNEGNINVIRTKEANGEEEPAEFTIEGVTEVSVDKSMLSTLVNNLAQISSNSIVSETNDDIAKYGLSPAAATVVFSYDGGEKKTVYIGDASPAASSTYFMLEGDSKVYTVSSSKINNFTLGIKAFYSTTILEDPGEEARPVVKNIRMKREDLDYDIYAEFDERTTDENYLGGVAASHIMKEPIECYLGFEKTTSFVYGLYGLMAKEIYSINPSESEIAEAGLAEPFCTVEMNCDDGNSYKFSMSEQFKDEDGNNCNYFMLDGVNVLYVVLTDNLNWTTVQPIDITSRTVFDSSVWDIKEMKISGKDIKEIDITADGTGEEDFSAQTSSGLALEKEHFRLFYKYLLAACAEELAIGKEIPQGAQPIVSISLLDGYMGDKPRVVEFYENDNYTSIIAVDGECRYITTSYYVDTLIENIAKIETGEEYSQNWKR